MTPRRGEALSRKVSDQDHLTPTWLPLPVDADGTQVQDAGRAHHDIQSNEDVAVNPAELPLAHHLETKQCHGWEAGLWRVHISGSLLGEVGQQPFSLTLQENNPSICICDISPFCNKIPGKSNIIKGLF